MIDFEKIYNSSYYLDQHHKAEQKSWDNGQLRYGDQCAALAYVFGIYDFDIIRDEFGFKDIGLDADPLIGVKLQLEKIKNIKKRNPKHVVEVGAGRCEFSIALSNTGIMSTAIEPASCVKDLIIKTEQNLHISPTDNFKLINEKLEDCIDEISDFDTIVFVESIEHLEPDEFKKVFPKIKDVLIRNSGILIIVNWINYHPLIPNGVDHIMKVDDEFFNKILSESKEELYRNGSHIVFQF